MDFFFEGGVIEKIVQRVGYLLNIEIDIALEILIPDWMEDVVSAHPFLTENHDYRIQVTYHNWKLHLNNVYTQILLNPC